MSRATVAAAALLVVVAQSASARAGDAPPVEATPASPTALVVALGLERPALQAGVVRGRDVILARGFEVELARVLARRLGARVERFVYVPSQPRLLASSGAAWELAFDGIDAGRAGRTAADLSTPYLTTDVAVVARRGLSRPRRLGGPRGAGQWAGRGAACARAL